VAASEALKRAIPGRLNLALAVFSGSGCLGLLWLASHTRSYLGLALAAVTFSYLNNTVFALLHEAEHKILHPNEAVNEWVGRVLGAFFPTSLTFHRVAHLNHHAHNRTDMELFDYIRPGESKALKYVQWYLLLTGVYWILPPLACLMYMVWPGFFRLKSLRSGTAAWQTATAIYAKAFDRAPETTVRLEVGLALLLQMAAFQLLDLNWLGWGCCYALFAVNWASLQYADHAFSQRDVVSGAWNLRVNPVVRAFFLNYHYHRAHHENPRTPWNQLHLHIQSDEPRPWFGHVYAQMWRGPRPLPAELHDGPSLEDVRAAAAGAEV
jgi:fatty acid desaturase